MQVLHPCMYPCMHACMHLDVSACIKYIECMYAFMRACMHALLKGVLCDGNCYRTSPEFTVLLLLLLVLLFLFLLFLLLLLMLLLLLLLLLLLFLLLFLLPLLFLLLLSLLLLLLQVSAIFFGGVDPRFFEPPIHMFPVVREHYWEVELDAIYVGERKFCCAEGTKNYVIIDSGTSFNTMPSNEMESFLEMIPSQVLHSSLYL